MSIIALSGLRISPAFSVRLRRKTGSFEDYFNHDLILYEAGANLAQGDRASLER
jgi:hypothetical protein